MRTGLFIFGLAASAGCLAGCISGAQAKASAVDTAVSIAAPHGAGTMAFGDLDRTLAEVPAKEASANPARFFEWFTRNGGMLTINHPLVAPLDSSFEMARVDLSWRMLTAPDRPVPPEIRAVDRLAASYEAYNTTATELRDRFLVGDRDKTLRDTLATYDRIIARDKRRITPVGGSDSHGHYVRATTFVMAKSLDQASLRDAIQNGRACIRSREACTLEARPLGGAFVGVGGTIDDADGKNEVRARGRDIEIFLDGERAAIPSSGFITKLDVPRDRCVSLRARVGDGYSAPIYVGCGTKDAR